jgi:phospholipase A1/A2
MIQIIVTCFIVLFGTITFAANPSAVEEPPSHTAPSNSSQNELPPNKDNDQDKDTKGPRRYEDLDDLFNLYQPYLGNISAHEPIYFLVGTEPENSKFQISLKYRFMNSEGSWSKKYPWLQGFHMAFTQTSFWDLDSDSKAFEDTSYKPEFFYRSSNLDLFGHSVTNFFIQTGYQHESNGKGGLDSRATDMVYVQPIFIFYHQSSRLGLGVSPRVWVYLSNEDDDLIDYRGYFTLGVAAGKADSWVFHSDFYWAKEGPSITIDATYPLREILFKNFDIYLQVQYANCLAESLLQFRERTQALRIGLAIIR